MTRIPIGTTFTLYGTALHPLSGRVMLLADVRVKDANGSHSVSREWLAESWPDTRDGHKAALARTGELNAQTAATFPRAAQSNENATGGSGYIHG